MHDLKLLGIEEKKFKKKEYYKRYVTSDVIRLVVSTAILSMMVMQMVMMMMVMVTMVMVKNFGVTIVSGHVFVQGLYGLHGIQAIVPHHQTSTARFVTVQG